MNNRKRERERERSCEDSNFDVIYIDPPYNTESSKKEGNNSANEKENISATKFIYRDKFSRNGWLNLMNERLRLAKKLLKDDGVIFVSIDDNEQAYLKVLMDEIFGEENFVTNFIWQKKSGGGLNTYIYEGHEYLICYGKHKNYLKKKLFFPKKINIKNIEKDSTGFYYWEKDFLRKNFGKKVDNEHRNIFYEELEQYKTKDEIKQINENIKLGNYKLFSYGDNKHLVAKKIYTQNNDYKLVTPYSIISGMWSSDGTSELENICGKTNFTTIKPLSLIKLIVNILNNKNARILDFFAGSGTTAHAVMELNKEDGGNRTFTLVTNNENNIAYGITYERLYRINHGVGTNGETFKWTEKNESYKQNLNVFNLKYDSIDIVNSTTETNLLIDTLRESLAKFGIKNITDEELLNNLTNLYALESDSKDETN
nr:site-specific DNA-methyltransferase [Mycoplasma miroungirhinis]